MTANIADTQVLIQRWMTAALQTERKTYPGSSAGDRLSLRIRFCHVMRALNSLDERWCTPCCRRLPIMPWCITLQWTD